MNKIDPNALLFHLPLSSSAGSSGEKTTAGDTEQPSQDHLQDFEGLLSKISQARRSQHVYGRSNAASNHSYPDDELSNTPSPRGSFSTQEVSSLENIPLKTIKAAQTPSAISFLKMPSIPENYSNGNSQKNSIASTSLASSSTNKNISREYILPTKSETNGPKTNSLSDLLSLSLAALGAGTTFSFAATATSSANSVSDQIMVKHPAQPPLSISNISASSVETSRLITSPIVPSAFFAQGQKIHLTVSDQQNHFAPVEGLSPSQPLSNPSMSQDTSAAPDQTEFNLINNIDSLNTHLNQKSVEILEPYNLRGSKAGNTLAKRPAVADTSVLTPIMESAVKPQPLTSNIISPTSMLQTHDPDLSVQLAAGQGSEVQYTTMLSKLSSAAPHESSTSQTPGQDLTSTKFSSIRQNHIQDYNLNNLLTEGISKNALTNNAQTSVIETNLSRQAGDLNVKAPTLSNSIMPSLTFRNNLGPDGSFYGSRVSQGNQSEGDTSLASLRISNALDDSLGTDTLTRERFTSEVSQTLVNASVNSPTKDNLNSAGFTQKSFEQELAETYSSVTESELKQNTTVKPFSAASFSAVGPETRTNQDSGSLQNASKFLLPQDLEDLSHLRRSETDDFRPFATTATLAVSGNSSSTLLNSFDAKTDTTSDTVPSRRSSSIPSGSLLEKENFSTSKNTADGAVPSSTLKMPFLPEAQLNVLSTAPSRANCVDLIPLEVTVTPSLTRDSPKTEILDSPKAITGNQTADVQTSRIVAEYPLRSISYQAPLADTTSTNKTSFNSDRKTKNSGELILQKSISGISPEVQSDSENPFGSDVLIGQNKAGSFSDFGNGSSGESEHPNYVIASKPVSVLQPNIANLPVEISPVDQITALIIQGGAKASSESSFPPSNVEQPSGFVLSSGVKTLSLALEPQDLGNVIVKLRLSKNGLDMHVEADRLGTVQMIEKEKDNLVRGLQDSGYLVDSLVVKATANQPTNLQQGLYEETGKPGFESNQPDSQTTGSSLHQENSNANDGNGREDKNSKTNFVRPDTTSGDISRSARNGDVYI